jgi:hypothetical protein
MKKQRIDATMREYADILRGHGDKYSEFMLGLADTLEAIAGNFDVQQTALRYIYENLGHDFEFPKLDEDEDTKYGIHTHVYPKDGDPTVWTVRLEVEFEDGEGQE